MNILDFLVNDAIVEIKDMNNAKKDSFGKAFTEEEIRPKNLMEQCSKLASSDRKKLLAHKGSFISVPCPACGTKHSNVPSWKKVGFIFLSCDKCETIFVSPRPSAKVLGEYYANAEMFRFWNKEIFPKSEDARRKNIFKPRAKKVVELCEQHQISLDLIMDIGAGFGTFCEEIQRFNKFRSVVAVEPAKSLAESCRLKGLNVVEKSVEDLENYEADVITAFELIEHLFDPKEFLLFCRKSLKKDGVMILTTPNIQGFDLLTLRDKSDNIEAPNHINYFSPKSLIILMESCGFQVLEVLTPGQMDAELVRTKALDGAIDLSNQPFLKKILIDDWTQYGDNFQKFLVSNKLSSHLWVVAKNCI